MDLAWLINGPWLLQRAVLADLGDGPTVVQIDIREILFPLVIRDSHLN